MGSLCRKKNKKKDVFELQLFPHSREEAKLLYNPTSTGPTLISSK